MHGHLGNNQWYTGNITKHYFLLGNVEAGIGEFTGMGYHVDNMQMLQTAES